MEGADRPNRSPTLISAWTGSPADSVPSSRLITTDRVVIGVRISDAERAIPVLHSVDS